MINVGTEGENIIQNFFIIILYLQPDSSLHLNIMTGTTSQ